jgi:hypothetical protein
MIKGFTVKESPLLPEETPTQQDGLKILAKIIVREILREGRKKPLPPPKNEDLDNLFSK